MNFYPEETKGPISEVWQAERWHEFDPSHHTPTCYIGGKQFWINELAKLSDNRLVIPKTWVKCEGVVCADAEEVTIDNVCRFDLLSVAIHPYHVFLEWKMGKVYGINQHTF